MYASRARILVAKLTQCRMLDALTIARMPVRKASGNFGQAAKRPIGRQGRGLEGRFLQQVRRILRRLIVEHADFPKNLHSVLPLLGLHIAEVVCVRAASVGSVHLPQRYRR